jgi:hypothetical protein
MVDFSGRPVAARLCAGMMGDGATFTIWRLQSPIRKREWGKNVLKPAQNPSEMQVSRNAICSCFTEIRTEKLFGRRSAGHHDPISK